MNRPVIARGFKIEAIELQSASFERFDNRPNSLLADVDDGLSRWLDLHHSSKASKPEEFDGAITTIVEYTLVATGLASANPDRPPDTELTREWQSATAYRGYFRIDPSGPIGYADFVRVHAPAYIYSFVREQVADTLRRSGLQVFLPPVSFMATQKNDDPDTSNQG